MEKIKVPVILGPTAVGKSDLCLQLAQKFDYEIISCDSRQIYRHMDIGTAKVTPSEMREVRHWFINIINPDKPYSAHVFSQQAVEIIRQRSALGKKVLVCGGTGLYFYSLSDGLGAQDVADVSLRNSLQQRARSQGSGSLYEELRRCDPESSKKLHPNDLQRIVRALEVFYKTGKPLSVLQEKKNPPSDIDFLTCVVTSDREKLYQKINKRVDEMFSCGLFEEYRLLRALGYDENSPGMQCVGYRELFQVDRKEMSFSQGVEKIKQNTRKYAKRQLTWFRNKTKGAEICSEHALDRLGAILSGIN
ncbi:tRNA dimethylallyltransferase [Chitinispirillum alkaliphilum]|nr:tRNA dimethylallyltransferase [Chitinispirillum alkaliphilum]